MAIKKGLKMVVGAVLFAVAMWGVLVAPGFLSDQDSTVRGAGVQEARQ